MMAKDGKLHCQNRRIQHFTVLHKTVSGSREKTKFETLS